MVLHAFVNAAQLPPSSVQQKQLQKQLETKTADIETQLPKPLSKTKNWLEKPS